MNLESLPHGKNVPLDINVTIEIPSHGSPVKYEVDKALDPGKWVKLESWVGVDDAE